MAHVVHPRQPRTGYGIPSSPAPRVPRSRRVRRGCRQLPGGRLRNRGITRTSSPGRRIPFPCTRSADLAMTAPSPWCALLRGQSAERCEFSRSQRGWQSRTRTSERARPFSATRQAGERAPVTTVPAPVISSFGHPPSLVGGWSRDPYLARGSGIRGGRVVSRVVVGTDQ